MVFSVPACRLELPERISTLRLLGSDTGESGDLFVGKTTLLIRGPQMRDPKVLISWTRRLNRDMSTGGVARSNHNASSTKF